MQMRAAALAVAVPVGAFAAAFALGRSSDGERPAQQAVRSAPTPLAAPSAGPPERIPGVRRVRVKIPPLLTPTPTPSPTPTATAAATIDGGVRTPVATEHVDTGDGGDSGGDGETGGGESR